jgi:hypothetical protein
VRFLAAIILLSVAFSLSAASVRFGPETPATTRDSLGSQTDVAVASAGGDPIIAWREGAAIRARRGTGQEITVATTIFTYGPVGLAADNETVWMWWLDRGSVFVRRYHADLQPIDPAPLAAAATQSMPAAAAGSGKLLLTWSAYAYPDADLVCLVLDNDGPLNATPFPLAPALNTDHDPAVVWTGSDFVVAWAHQLYADFRDGGLPPVEDDIRIAHVTTSGGQSPPVTIPYDHAAANVRIAARAADLAVAWEYVGWSPGAFGGISGSIIRAGVPSAVQRWVDATNLSSLGDLVARRDDYLIVWREAASNTEWRFAHRLIDRDGVPDAVTTFSPMPQWSSLAVIRAGAFGTIPFLVYSRAVDDAPFNGALRLFVRLPDLAPRLRTVR